MKIKNSAIYLALVLIVCTSGFSQTVQPKFSDDRELFIGVPGSRVMPNIMVLANNSISMATAIYHPGYNPNLFYDHVDPADQTCATVSLSNYNAYTSLGSTATFNICGDKGAYVLRYNYRARYNSQNHPNPRRWNITVLDGTWDDANVKNKIVSWGCTNTPNSCTNSTTITGVNSAGIITVNPG